MTAHEGIGDINATVQSVQDWTATDWIIAIAAVWLLRRMIHSSPSSGPSRERSDRPKRRRYDDEDY